MIRSFVGLPVPPGAVRKVEVLQDGLPTARAVLPEHLHLTLAFLDDQPQGALREVAAALDEVRSGPIGISLSGIKLMGGRQPAAIAIGADGGDALIRLQARVAHAIRSVGIELERRRFRPHVTIFRLSKRVARDDAPRIQTWINAVAPFDPISYTVDTMSFYRSILSKSGAVYDVLADYPLIGRDI